MKLSSRLWAGVDTSRRTGTLTFYDDGKLIKTVPVSHEASFTLPPLSPGTHIFTVAYSGDDSFEPAVSKPVVHTVGPTKRRAK